MCREFLNGACGCAFHREVRTERVTQHMYAHAAKVRATSRSQHKTPALPAASRRLRASRKGRTAYADVEPAAVCQLTATSSGRNGVGHPWERGNTCACEKRGDVHRPHAVQASRPEARQDVHAKIRVVHIPCRRLELSRADVLSPWSCRKLREGEHRRRGIASIRVDAYDYAFAETVIGLFKTEVIRRRGPWRSLETVEFATLEWVDWFNTRRLLEPIASHPAGRVRSARLCAGRSGLTHITRSPEIRYGSSKTGSCTRTCGSA
jgi:hypothetical protein